MATISISQLDTATQAKVDDLYEVAVVDENSQTGYASRKLTAAQIATLIAQGVQFSGLSTEAKTIVAAINEAAQNGGTEVEANPTEEPTDTLETIGIDGTVYEVGGGSVEPVSKTVTGNPIHIEDAADAPIVSGTVVFEPVQDLHGYDKPWAGGNGKNKLPMTVDGIKALNTSGTWSGNVYAINGGSFTVNTDNDGNVTSINVNGTFTNVSSLYFISSNYVVSSECKMNGCPYNGTYNSTYSFWAVYDNTYEAVDSGNGITLPVGTITQIRIRIAANYNAQNLIFYPMIRLATETDPTFEPYSNICPIEGYTDCELEVTDDATSPTVTNTYTIDLAGTRYGGTVDLVSGVMRVDRAIVDMGDLDWAKDGTLYRADIPTAKRYPTNVAAPWLCECYQVLAQNSVGSAVCITSLNWIEAVTLWNTSFTSVTEVKNALSGQHLVYELVTPFTVQLTPEQIRTLEGTNNILTNMTSMTLEYITQDYQPLVKLIERSAGHHYSTQERVVGTWFGKPLYEKSWDVSIEIPSASANTWLSTGILTASVNCDTVVGGKLVDNSNQFILGNIGFIQQNTYFAINVPIGNRTITTVTIQFTKTTD